MAQGDLFVGCLFASVVLLIVSHSVDALFILRSQTGVGQKTLGFARALPPRKFCEKILMLRVVRNERSRGQFAGNFEQRDRNVSVGRALRKKRDPRE